MTAIGDTRPGAFLRRHGNLVCDLLVLAGIACFTAWYIPPSLLMLDTTTVGGDTPAHNYLASHLREQLLQHGRIISWAPGWWCGFPMFQYYFCLPYLIVALLSGLLPFNIAFKLASVLGIFILPACAYAGARIMRLPRPVPALSAIAMVPFLFVKSHVMWGANIYSTLAGMISNSLSFAIMVLAVARATRDADDGAFRLRTVLLQAAMIASHFFTSIVGFLAIGIVPLLRPRAGFRRAAAVVAGEAALAVLLMAWWLVPLVAKGAGSVDFGTDWSVSLPRTLPVYTAALLPMVAAAIFFGFRGARAALVLAWMLAAALALFLFGSRLSPVFVNIRLWPFLFYAILSLAAIGAGLLMRNRRATGLASLGIAVLVCFGVAAAGNDVRAWATWNYEGLQAKRTWPVFERLVLPLKGTPGRLANDLAEENNGLGSTRVFECVPHLIGKPILEGGIVNSAIGSLFSYYVQSETSKNAAGLPTQVNPGHFDITNATRHLALFNVKHVIARWPPLQQALAAAPEWRKLDEADGWQLYELTANDGHYVFIPARQPVAVRADDPNEAGLQWIYTPELLDRPFALLRPGEEADASMAPALSPAQFRRVIAASRPPDGELSEWLHLGPFHAPAGATNLLEYAPIDETRIDPSEGARQGGLAWQPLFGRGPILLNRLYRRDTHLVSYSHCSVFSPADRDAMLHYSNDDDARIWLNGERVVSTGITGLNSYRTVAVHLRKGRNRLLHKCTQDTGGQFLHLRLTAPDGSPMPDVAAGASGESPDLPPGLERPTGAARHRVWDERVEPDRISFRTDAIGLPHIVKVTHFPNWQVRGARHVYRVTPAFLLVYPDREQVELYYGATAADRAGWAATGVGLALLGAAAWALSRRREGWLGAAVSRIALIKMADATIGAALCWIIGYLRYRFADGPTTSERGGRRIRRLLVIRPGGMGDMILLLPVLRRLRQEFPDAAIDIVCERRNLEVLRLAGWADAATAYDAHPLRFLRLMLTRAYDAAIDTEQFHHFSAVLAFLSGAGVRVGFKITPARNLLYTHLINYAMDGYEGRQFTRLLEPLGVAADAPYQLEGILADRLPALPAAPAAAARLSAAGPLIVFAPGSSSRYKHWDTGRCAALVQALAGRGCGVALVGGRDAARVAAAILRGAAAPAGRVEDLTGRLSLAETVGVLREAALFVGTDSGVSHLAVALGLPTVVIFGPTDHLKWGIDDARHAIVRQPVACAPCFIFGYHRPCRTIACMGGVTVDDVLGACARLYPPCAPGGHAPKPGGTP